MGGKAAERPSRVTVSGQTVDPRPWSQGGRTRLRRREAVPAGVTGIRGQSAIIVVGRRWVEVVNLEQEYPELQSMGCRSSNGVVGSGMMQPTSAEMI
jgi:hypothetical protein